MTAFVRYEYPAHDDHEGAIGATGAPKEIQVLLDKIEKLARYERQLMHHAVGERYLNAFAKERAFTKASMLIEAAFIKHPSRIRPFPRRRKYGKKPVNR